MHAPSRIHAPLSYDDAIDLHDLLEADDPFVQLLSGSLLPEDLR
jgi:hypothetical protein